MQKKVTFGRIFWPSLVAVLIASAIGWLIFALVLGGIVGGLAGEERDTVRSNSILHMKLGGRLAERTDTKFDPSSFRVNSQLGLADVLSSLKMAAEDDQIKGIFLEVKGIEGGYASLKEIRSALKSFEESGKFVIAYHGGEMISQKEYFIGSAASKQYGFPMSNLMLAGLGAELMFFEQTLKKLDVEMQVIRGSNNSFKSAVEPFIRSNMSDSSRLQYEVLLNGIWQEIVHSICTEKGIKSADFNDWIQTRKITRVPDAVSLKLLDAAKYRDEVLNELKEKVGENKLEDLHFVDFDKYTRKKTYQQQVLAKNDNPNIAVILAEGGIAVEGDEMTSADICRQLRLARENATVKAIVLRVNSPGGSALASEEIWREVKLTNAKKKVVVSMGDVAASGGYYIAAPASTIFAEPTTITGSIGVFGVIPYTGKMFNDKLGITFDRVYTHHPMFSLNRKLTAEEVGIVQKEVDVIYSDFLQKVAEGRGMTVEQVQKVAGGRVWTGKDAKSIGLVDQLGGLKSAISFAGKGAQLKERDIKVVYYPLKKENKLEKWLEKLADEDDYVVESRLEIPDAFMQQLKKLSNLSAYTGYQMRLPFEITW